MQFTARRYGDDCATSATGETRQRSTDGRDRSFGSSEHGARSGASASKQTDGSKIWKKDFEGRSCLELFESTAMDWHNKRGHVIEIRSVSWCCAGYLERPGFLFFSLSFPGRQHREQRGTEDRFCEHTELLGFAVRVSDRAHRKNKNRSPPAFVRLHSILKPPPPPPPAMTNSSSQQQTTSLSRKYLFLSPSLSLISFQQPPADLQTGILFL